MYHLCESSLSQQVHLWTSEQDPVGPESSGAAQLWPTAPWSCVEALQVLIYNKYIKGFHGSIL